METFSPLLAICAGNSPVTGEFPAQRPVTRSFGVFFYLRLNERLSKESWGWWFETPSRPLWRHSNGDAGWRLFLTSSLLFCAFRKCSATCKGRILLTSFMLYVRRLSISSFSSWAWNSQLNHIRNPNNWVKYSVVTVIGPLVDIF